MIAEPVEDTQENRLYAYVILTTGSCIEGVIAGILFITSVVDCPSRGADCIWNVLLSIVLLATACLTYCYLRAIQSGGYFICCPPFMGSWYLIWFRFLDIIACIVLIVLAATVLSAKDTGKEADNDVSYATAIVRILCCVVFMFVELPLMFWNCQLPRFVNGMAGDEGPSVIPTMNTGPTYQPVVYGFPRQGSGSRALSPPTAGYSEYPTRTRNFEPFASPEIRATPRPVTYTVVREPVARSDGRARSLSYYQTNNQNSPYPYYTRPSWDPSE